MRPLALVAATTALLAGLTGQPAVAADEPTLTQLTLGDDLFKLTDTSTVTAATALDGKPADAGRTDVVATEYPTDSAGAADPGMNLGAMRACAGDETKALPPVDRKIAWCRPTRSGSPSSTGTPSGTATSCSPSRRPAGRTSMFVTGHGGGVVRYANHLYVTDTTGGIRVFDINELSKVDTYGSGLNTYGIDSAGRSSACGYPYVLPQVHYYKQASAPPSDGCDTDAVDGTPDADSLRYQLNPTSASTYPGLLNMSGGRTVIQDAYGATRHVGLQGGMTWTDDAGLLNFAFHKGCALQPAVFSRTRVGDTRAPTPCNVTVDGVPHANGNRAVGTPQALSHWPKLGRAQVDELWGLTEHICAGPALRAGFPHEFPAVEESDERRNACDGYAGAADLSLRTVFAVGFTDPAVMDLR